MHTAYTLSNYNVLVIRVIVCLKNLLQDKGNIMKKLILASILTLGLGAGFAYAGNKAATELEHANKTATSAEGVAGDMSAMKAAGKCNADQTGKKKTTVKRAEKKKSKSAMELEHANKLSTGADGIAGDMGKMKAQGKCGSN